MALCRRERPAPADFKMSTRERSKTRDRSKSSDASGEQSQGTIGQGRGPPAALQRSISASRSAHPASAAARIPALQQSHSTAAADLLVAAAEAVNRTAAGQGMAGDAQRMSCASPGFDAWDPDANDELDLDDKAGVQNRPDESEAAEPGQGTVKKARHKVRCLPLPDELPSC